MKKSVALTRVYLCLKPNTPASWSRVPMPEWYYRDNQDRTVGPVKPSEMLELIRGGELREDTLVRKDDSPWVRSVEINGLWAAAARPDTQFFCPVCQTELPKPPCRCPKCLKYVDKGVGRIKQAGVSARQLAKIREAASQPIQPTRTVKPNIEESQPIPHIPKNGKPQTASSRWWHSLLPRKK